MADVTNTLLTNDVITNEALRVLRNNFVLVPRCMRTVDDLFGQVGYKNGSTIRVRIPVRYTSAIGAGVNLNNSTETQTTLTLVQRNIGIAFTSKDLTLSIDLFKERFIVPAIAQLATDIEQDGFKYFYLAQSLVTPGSLVNGAPAQFTGADVSGLRPWLDATARLAEQAAPIDDERYAALTPSAQAATVDSLKGLFQSATEIAEQYRKGLMGRTGGLEFVLAQTLPSFTTGTRANTANTDGVVSSGTTIGLKSMTANTATVVQGDQFVISGVYAINPLTRLSTNKLQVFTVQAPATANAGGYMSVSVLPAISTLAPNQTVSANVADSVAVTFMGGPSVTTDVNLVWHRDAFLVAFCDLTDDLPGAEAYVARDPESKIALRMVRQYNSVTDENTSRLDVLYGFNIVRPQLACRVQG